MKNLINKFIILISFLFVTINSLSCMEDEFYQRDIEQSYQRARQRLVETEATRVAQDLDHPEQNQDLAVVLGSLQDDDIQQDDSEDDAQDTDLQIGLNSPKDQDTQVQAPEIQEKDFDAEVFEAFCYDEEKITRKLGFGPVFGQDDNDNVDQIVKKLKNRLNLLSMGIDVEIPSLRLEQIGRMPRFCIDEDVAKRRAVAAGDLDPVFVSHPNLFLKTLDPINQYYGEHRWNVLHFVVSNNCPEFINYFYRKIFEKFPRPKDANQYFYSLVWQKDSNGNTPLHLALKSENCNIEILKKFILFGKSFIDPNVHSQNFVALKNNEDESIADLLQDLNIEKKEVLALCLSEKSEHQVLEDAQLQDLLSHLKEKYKS